MTHWSEHTIWWHVYPLGFTGAPVRPTPDERILSHRLKHIENSLDYLIELGCNGLALGPIFSAHTHGYDTIDFYSIDPRLGNMADFESLVSACKKRGIRIMLDGVFNHVGSDSNYAELSQRDHVFEGHDNLHTLDHSSPAVKELISDVMNFWLDKGIDSWRLDAAYAVPIEFWSSVIPRVHKAHPDAWIMGEVIHGDYPAYAAPINSVTQYELWKSIWSSLADGNFFELDWTLQRHNNLLDHFIPLTFIGNHDVTRIATKVGKAKAALALTILMTVGGIPAIYYGDEQGYEGSKEDRLGGDDEVRPFFPLDQPDGNPTFELHQRLIAFRRRHPWLTTARTQQLELENTRLRFRSTGANQQAVEVLLELGDAPYAQISVAEEPDIHIQLT
ncbi:alpha-amylase family protein [Corynebacterium sp. H128]|uniref:alpha-amylase family protein n=1 Tax=unclassified Corynebacterium TaxID=2624378 RepID=UPI0030B3B73E